ncbi:MAG TPA: monovalent cation/H(+) antiporter subunit G [Acidimicrobiales bacterium]|nr:monovalent cation/H(+) antiporter subunit G [Acidimicrobiales bacterium]
MADVIVGILAIAGALFVLLAGVGVLRFPDLYARMHAATKATTVGIALVGIAGAIAIDGGTAKIVLAVAVIFVTAPSAAHFIGRAAYRAEGVDIRLDGRDDLGDLGDLLADDAGDG